MSKESEDKMYKLLCCLGGAMLIAMLVVWFLTRLPVAPAVGQDFTMTADITTDVLCVVPAYDRKEWRHWEDHDGDCQDTRQEVLARQSTLPVVWSEDGCKVVSGAWSCPYTGRLFSDPKKLDVDHMVPLANAHLSGGWAWGELKREHYANWLRDPCHLIAVQARANRQKGAKGPEQWLPEKNRCWYVECWLGVKEKSGLTLTAQEAREVAKVLKSCPADD